MKAKYSLLIIFLLSITVTISFGQKQSLELKQETIKVWGNCGMCKSTIEKAAKGAGASYAVWNKKSKRLTVKYFPSKSSRKKIEEKISIAGYDTENFTAPAEAYNKLHVCCKYDRKIIIPGDRFIRRK